MVDFEGCVVGGSKMVKMVRAQQLRDTVESKKEKWLEHS